MANHYTIRLALEYRSNATTEIAIEGNAGLSHLITVFQLAVSAMQSRSI